jgi:hypothetical protein
MFQAKLKLLCERAMMQSLVTLKLLAEEKLDSPLLGLMFLLGQWVIEPLEDLRLRLDWEIHLWRVWCFCLSRARLSP